MNPIALCRNIPLKVVVPMVLLCAAACTDNQGVDRVTTVFDTLRVHDTTIVDIGDTVRVLDTLYDTAKIPIGRQDLLLAGLIMGGIGADSSSQLTDSCYGALTAVGNPEPSALIVSINGRLLPYESGQNRDYFMASLSDPLALGAFAGAFYDSLFTDTSRSFLFSVIAPNFPTDTSTTPVYDTIVDSARIPGDAGKLVFSHDSNVIYDSIDYFEDYGPGRSGYRILLDRALTISWKSSAAWYAVECTKYLQTAYDYVPVGETIDTFTTATSMTLPKSFVYQDTTFDTASSYDFLYVVVVPVHGPSPSTWDTMPSWGGHGYLFAIRYYSSEMTVTANPFLDTRTGAAKRRMQRPARVAPQTVVSRLFQKLRPAAQ